ncbi:protein lifeguard 1-like [Bacillus rossius redtenbacheri]|uniref:protein lifeguard 1-like n=1 Tax=Bacillus rossius redtenbacheri TaxID=93214 RepID=UPI002FDCE957
MYSPGPDGLLGGESFMGDFKFSDTTVRHAFIRKVYSLLTVQIAITLALIALVSYHEPARVFMQAHPEVWWIAFALMLVTIIGMACCPGVRRRSPLNLVFLLVFTLAQGFMLAALAATYNRDLVLMAVGLTAAVCLALTLFALQTKWDFTMCGGALLVAAVVLMVFGIVAICVPGKTVVLVYASLASLLFGFYLVFDTQVMLGGAHKYAVSPEEYVFATLTLYLDVVNIFVNILTILRLVRD